MQGLPVGSKSGCRRVFDHSPPDRDRGRFVTYLKWMCGRLSSGPPVTIVLPLNCWSCGVAIDVQVANWSDPKPAIRQSFRCPDCRTEQRADLPGQVRFVAKRNEPFRKPMRVG